MKNLLFICGANGIGKTTICRSILKRLANSAYVDSDSCRAMNPFVLNDDTIPAIQKNISCIIKNFFDCPAVQTVIFSYGLHGRRREIFNGIIEDIAGYEYNFIPLLLVCGESENIRRMNCDGRDTERIQRAVEASREAYADIGYLTLDISVLSVDEAAARIMELAELCR
jgi:GTPase SAR1 family protein